MKCEMLPEQVKAGIIWDAYQNSLHRGERFQSRFWELVDEYDLADGTVGRLYALIKASRTIGIAVNRDGLVACQSSFELVAGNVTVTGIVGRAYTDHFVEAKLSGRPDFHHRIHNITSQVATYFLSDERYEYCIIEAVRLPQLRTGYGKYSSEDPTTYMERLHGDILSRPSSYFSGFNRDDRTFGKRFWRNEFPLDQIREDYEKINRDIQRAIEEDAFYPNYSACHVPSSCFYLPVCETGVVSDTIYRRKPTTSGGYQS